MPESILSQRPEEFLIAYGADLKVLETFKDPERVTVVRVTDTDFIRGAGTENTVVGHWWTRMDELDKILHKIKMSPRFPNEGRNVLRRQFRDETAVSVNWNNLNAFWCLRISAEGLRGETKAQPVWDPSRSPAPAGMGNATQRMLPGGI